MKHVIALHFWDVFRRRAVDCSAGMMLRPSVCYKVGTDKLAMVKAHGGAGSAAKEPVL